MCMEGILPKGKGIESRKSETYRGCLMESDASERGGQAPKIQPGQISATGVSQEDGVPATVVIPMIKKSSDG